MKANTWFTSVALIAGLVAFGSTSSSWFHTTVDHRDIRDGVFGNEDCGFGRSADELDDFGREQATGVKAPPRPWTCEREVWLLQAGRVHGAFIIDWATMVLTSAAGLVLAALMLVSMRRRRLGRSVFVVAIVSLVAALAYIVLGILAGDYAPTALSHGAFAYVLGASAAIVVARRWPVIAA